MGAGGGRDDGDGTAPAGVAGGTVPVGPGAEHLDLGGGRTLDVRAPGPADVAALERLYADLPIEDVHRRFFSAFRPDADELRTWIERIPDHGRRLVAVRPDGEVVADAGYVRLDDGDAELDLVVAPKARGWLGSYLLDRLVATARADGVRNLVADVLVENRPMLALIRRRSHVVLDRDDYTVAHLRIACAAETPVWPDAHDRLRILVEGSGLGWIPTGQIESLGIDAVVCPGPARPPRTRCPLLEGRPCPLAEGADAVLCALGARPDVADALLAAHERDHPDLPRFRTAPAGPAGPTATAAGTSGPGGADGGAVVVGPERPALEAVVHLLGGRTDLPRRHPPADT